MRRLIVKPDGWPCKLKECPPGLFLYQDCLAIKPEYSTDHPYVALSGEVFWGGAVKIEDRAELLVQPCMYEWETFES